MSTQIVGQGTQLTLPNLSHSNQIYSPISLVWSVKNEQDYTLPNSPKFTTTEYELKGKERQKTLDHFLERCSRCFYILQLGW